MKKFRISRIILSAIAFCVILGYLLYNWSTGARSSLIIVLALLLVSLIFQVFIYRLQEKLNRRNVKANPQ